MVIKMKKVFFAFFCVLILAGGNSLFAQNFDDDSDSPFMEREEPFSEVFPNDDADIESLENEIEDLEKAAWYINREIQRLEKLKKNKDRKQVDYER